jgi:hypothetical protein
MGKGYAAIQKGGGVALPVVRGGGSVMTHSAGSVITQSIAFRYVMASVIPIFKTGYVRFAKH